jgi:hypothetical protein
LLLRFFSLTLPRSYSRWEKKAEERKREEGIDIIDDDAHKSHASLTHTNTVLQSSIFFFFSILFFFSSISSG